MPLQAYTLSPGFLPLPHPSSEPINSLYIITMTLQARSLLACSFNPLSLALAQDNTSFTSLSAANHSFTILRPVFVPLVSEYVTSLLLRDKPFPNVSINTRVLGSAPFHLTGELTSLILLSPFIVLHLSFYQHRLSGLPICTASPAWSIILIGPLESSHLPLPFPTNWL